MARFIQSFANDAAIQSAVDSKELGHPYVALNEATGKMDWNSKDIDYSKMYMTVEALESGNFYVRNSGVGYSVNGGDWQTTTGETALSLNSGDAVRFKHESNNNHNGLFSGNTLSFNAYGNIESLEYGDDFTGKTVNKKEFIGCFRQSGIVDAGNLILPATSLARQNYDNMFQSCTSLTTAPALPATSPSERCYQSMFANCTRLTYIKCMLTDLMEGNPWGRCTQNWVSGVAATGTFVKNPAMNDWPTGIYGIPSGWTVVDAQ